jgi:putative PIN family toxin of toxin-antitoxin system
MRLVLDTNTVVSGLLWSGSPRHLLDAARAGQAVLYTSLVLLAELDDVLQRPRFAARLRAAGISAQTLVVGYAALAVLVPPAPIAPVILADPDDDAVLACAVAAQADAMVSGDRHLLALGSYHTIPILTAPDALTRLSTP